MVRKPISGLAWRSSRWMLGLALLAAACDDVENHGSDAGQPTGDAGADAASPDAAGWYDPDPLGRVTEGNLIETPPELLVVTTAALEAEFATYAAERTVLGTRARVERLEDLMAGQAGADDADRLRAALAVRVAGQGLRFVLLGGDGELLPYRRVESYITVPTMESYSTHGPSQLFYANLTLDWDADGDGVPGEKDQDFSLADARTTQVAVGRVPASTAAEVAAYRAKVAAHATARHGRETYPLLLSDIAGSVPLIGDIDGAEGNEVTVGAFFPDAFRQHARRLYATEGAVESYGGDVLSPALVSAALDEGYSLVLHQGHGSHRWLTDKLDRSFVDGLGNALPPVVLSCACLSGNFADVASTPTFDGWTVQTADEASAGERLIVGEHGAVAYVGNTAVGLGPIGGSQFLHAMAEAFFVEGLLALGEAFNHARTRMRSIDWSVAYLPSMMTDDSEWWTQHAVILLGDPSLRLVTEEGQTLTVEAPASYGPGWNEITVTVRDGQAQPVAGAVVRLAKTDDLELETPTDVAGEARFAFLPFGAAPIAVGVTGDGLRPFLGAIAPVP